MAITATATILETACELPTGYTVPTLPSITKDADGIYTVDLSITNADAASATTGLGNVISASETDFETTQATALGLNSALTINANLTILKVERVNKQGTANGGIFITGTEVFRTTVRYEYEV